MKLASPAAAPLPNQRQHRNRKDQVSTVVAVVVRRTGRVLSECMVLVMEEGVEALAVEVVVGKAAVVKTGRTLGG